MRQLSWISLSSISASGWHDFSGVTSMSHKSNLKKTISDVCARCRTAMSRQNGVRFWDHKEQRSSKRDSIAPGFLEPRWDSVNQNVVTYDSYHSPSHGVLVCCGWGVESPSGTTPTSKEVPNHTSNNATANLSPVARFLSVFCRGHHPLNPTRQF